MTAVNDLPEEIPLMLLRGAILFPKARFPLPLMDPLHLSIVAQAWKDKRWLGLIQPNFPLSQPVDSEDVSLFSIGTLARIVDIEEADERKVIVVLEGVCRFTLEKQTKIEGGFPLGAVSYEGFTEDLQEEEEIFFDRSSFLTLLTSYFKKMDVDLKSEEVNKISDQKLITALSMSCPFLPSEKQILLETKSLQEQSAVIQSLIQMALHGGDHEHPTYH